MAKGDIVHNEQLLLLPTMFLKKSLAADAYKNASTSGKGLNDKVADLQKSVKIAI